MWIRKKDICCGISKVLVNGKLAKNATMDHFPFSVSQLKKPYSCAGVDMSTPANINAFFGLKRILIKKKRKSRNYKCQAKFQNSNLSLYEDKFFWVEKHTNAERLRRCEFTFDARWVLKKWDVYFLNNHKRQSLPSRYARPLRLYSLIPKQR